MVVVFIAALVLLFQAAALPAEPSQPAEPSLPAEPAHIWTPTELASPLFEEHGVIKMIVEPAGGLILAANRAAREFYGYPDLTEMRIGEINQLSAAEVADEMSRAAASQVNFFLFRHATANRGVRDVEVYSYPITLEGAPYLYSIIFDVTDRLVAQRRVQVYRTRLLVVFTAVLVAGLLGALVGLLRVRKRLRSTSASLRQKDAVYRSYVSSAPLGIFVTDETGRYLEVNPEASHMTGYPAEELVGMRIADLIVAEQHEEAREHFHRAVRDGRSAGILAYTTRTGEKRWWNVVANRVAEDRILGFAEDVTERRRGEEARWCLLEAATRLQSLDARTLDFHEITETDCTLSGAFCGVLNLLEPHGETFVTTAVTGAPETLKKAGELMGFSLEGHQWALDPLREAALGTRRTSVFPTLGALASGSFSTTLANTVARVCNLGEVTVSRIETPEGTLGDVVLLFSRGTCMQHQDLVETFTGMVGITILRIRAEERNRKLLGEKETLLREVQHRIKNNMNTMTSILSLEAQRVRGTRVAEEVLQDMRSRFRSMAVLYDRLYRTDGFLGGSLSEYLQTLVPQVVQLFPGGSEVHLEVHTPPAVESNTNTCELDAQHLSTVGLIVNELVTNAMKYAFPREGTGAGALKENAALTVDVACRAGVFRISVEDNGVGLPGTFDPQHPAGFGITMVQAMAQQLDGAIQYHREEEPGSPGTRITLTFPHRHARDGQKGPESDTPRRAE